MFEIEVILVMSRAGVLLARRDFSNPLPDPLLGQCLPHCQSGNPVPISPSVPAINLGILHAPFLYFPPLSWAAHRAGSSLFTSVPAQVAGAQLRGAFDAMLGCGHAWVFIAPILTTPLILHSNPKKVPNYWSRI